MEFVNLKKDGNVIVLTMNHKGTNVFNPKFVKALDQALDEVEAQSDICALVVAGGEEKFFSTGLDLDWIGEDFSTVDDFMPAMTAFWRRLLLFPMLTVACINGHAYAAGALFAVHFDYRFMREDRGYITMPEIPLGITVPYAGMKMLEKVVSPAIARDMIFRAKKYDGPSALKCGFVDGIFSKDELLPKAIEFAKAQSIMNQKAFSLTKRSVYSELHNIIQKQDWSEFVRV